MGKRTPVSPEAEAKHAADVALAERFDDLFAQAQAAERDLRDAQANRASLEEQHRLGKRLDAALTDVMRAAFAAQRAAIGPRGYDDRIYRRKAMATQPVRAWTMEAERLLTLRESHRLTGIVRLPPTPGTVVDQAASPAATATA
jgi:D-alanyl-D-alanine dipeptidase